MTANQSGTRTEQKLLIQFLADEAFIKKYEQARSLLSQRLSDTSFARVFDALMSEFLECHSPAHRKARRDTKKKLRKRAPARPQHAAARPADSNQSHAMEGRQTAKPHQIPEPHNTAQGPRTTSRSQTRHIPASVRDEVFVRDKGLCTYTGKTGKRCESTQALQIDHIVPFARGGPATASNLRLLCAKHNRLAAEEVFGETLMKQFRRKDEQLHQRE